MARCIQAVASEAGRLALMRYEPSVFAESGEPKTTANAPCCAASDWQPEPGKLGGRVRHKIVLT